MIGDTPGPKNGCWFGCDPTYDWIPCFIEINGFVGIVHDKLYALPVIPQANSHNPLPNPSIYRILASILTRQRTNMSIDSKTRQYRNWQERIVNGHYPAVSGQ